MKLNSLALRLFATAAVWAVLVLPAAGFIIDYVHKREVKQAFDGRLGQLLTLIIAFSTDHGGPEPRVPRNVGEPLFELAHSGWYWQITPLESSPGKRLISASLASEELPLPSTQGINPDAFNIRWHFAKGPVGEPLRVAETLYNAGEDENPRFYSYVVAGNIDFAETRIAGFRFPLILSLALAGLGLVLSTFLQVRFGLLPLRAIEKRLAAIRSGEAQRLEGKPPAEIEPLQTELNALIQSNQDIIERARTQVGNLAHALKTPLSVISNEAAADPSPLAGKVREQTAVMRDQVAWYLDRARAAARSSVIGASAEVAASLTALVRTFQKIYADRAVDFEIRCAEGLRFRGERQDFEEMLGNLIDNAGKWAASRVLVTVVDAPPEAGEAAPGFLAISVEDDGPGLPAERRQEALGRGQRLDETKPGSGLGLSIVADLAKIYGGSLVLEDSALGGLRAALRLPSA